MIDNVSNSLVAACQFDPKDGDIDSNLAKAQQLAFEAAAKGAKIIVLPELCFSGYEVMTKNDAASLGQTQEGYQTQTFVPISKQFNCTIVFGYIELSDNELYNSAIAIQPTKVYNTRKCNLEGTNVFWATSSGKLNYPKPVIPTTLGRLGILIGSDCGNSYNEKNKFFKPGLFYSKGSCDVIAVPMNWTKNDAYPSSEWIGLSESINTNVIISNRIGKSNTITFNGGSCIIDRNSSVWTNGSSFTDEAVVGGIIK